MNLRLASFSFVLVCFLSLTACGQKGPLIVPETTTEAVSAEAVVPELEAVAPEQDTPETP